MKFAKFLKTTGVILLVLLVLGGIGGGIASAYLYFDAQVTYSINLLQSENGHIYIENSSVPLKNGRELKKGESAQIIVKPNKGYFITEVMHNGRVLNIDGIGKGEVYDDLWIKNINVEQEVKAKYERMAYTVDINSNNNGWGQVSTTAQKGVVSFGGDVVFDVIPDEGYTIQEILINNKTLNFEVEEGASFSKRIDEIQEDLKIVVEFAPRRYRIDLEYDGAYGTVKEGADVVNKTFNIVYNKSVTFSVSSAKGYKIKSIFKNDEKVILDENATTAKINFLNVKENGRLDVIFTPIKVDFNIPNDFENGQIAPFGKISLDYGSSQIFTITPVEGYKINTIQLSVNGGNTTSELVTATPGESQKIKVENITSGVVLKVTFTKLKYTITVDDTINGTISPSTQYVDYGSKLDFIITPIAGYKIERIVFDRVDHNFIVTEGMAYTFTNEELKFIKKDHIISATFVPITTILTVHGVDNAITEPFLQDNMLALNYYEPLDFIVKPNLGYTIVSVTLNGQDIDISTLKEGASYVCEFKNVQKEQKLMITIERIKKTISIEVGANGTMSPTSEQTVLYGDPATFFINPDEGFRVDKFLVNGEQKSVEEIGKDQFKYEIDRTYVDTDIKVTFIGKTFKISSPENNTHGVILHNREEIPFGASEVVTFTPDATYELKSFIINGKEIPLEEAEIDLRGVVTYKLIDIRQNYQINAKFDKIRYTITVEKSNKGTVLPDTISYDVGFKDIDYNIRPVGEWKVKRVYLVDAEGREINLTINDNGDGSVLAKFNMIDKDYTLHVEYEGEDVQIITSVVNGKINISTTTVPYDSNQEFIVTANEGYVIEKIEIITSHSTIEIPVKIGEDGKTATFTIKNIKEQITIKATIVLKK